MSRARNCCDGQCVQGRHCPALRGSFAPGVIDGPHRKAPVHRLRTVLRQLARLIGWRAAR